MADDAPENIWARLAKAAGVEALDRMTKGGAESMQRMKALAGQGPYSPDALSEMEQAQAQADQLAQGLGNTVGSLGNGGNPKWYQKRMIAALRKQEKGAQEAGSVWGSLNKATQEREAVYDFMDAARRTQDPFAVTPAGLAASKAASEGVKRSLIEKKMAYQITADLLDDVGDGPRRARAFLKHNPWTTKNR